MKLTTALLTIVLLQASATGVAQHVTYTGRRISLEKIFHVMEQQTGYVFFYKNQDIAGTPPLTVDWRQTPLKDALEECLKTPSLRFNIQGNTIFITPAPVTPVQPEQAKDLQGTITDEKGEPLIGATVRVKGTDKAALTNDKGAFLIRNTDPGAVLQVSFIGYEPQEVPVTKQTGIHIIMKTANKSLSDVVVIGYGQVKRENLTGAVSSVKAAAFADRAVASPEEALAGQVAGVQVMQQTGLPGASLNLKIRGTNTITAGATPLYVVDGVPMDDIRDLNPTDIASLDVLKDAASAAIYGARGGNGVVMITTKKGKKGKPVASLSMYTGFQKADKMTDVMDGPGYIAYQTWSRNEDWRRRGGDLNAPMSSRPADLQVPDAWKDPASLPNNNWQEIIFHNAPMQSYQVGIQGGGDIGTFSLSAGYLDQQGIMRYSGYKRINFRLNTAFNLGKQLRAGLNVVPSFSTQNDPETQGKESVIHHAQNTPPIMPLQSNTQDWGFAAGLPTYVNVLERLKEVKRTNKALNLLNDAFVEWLPAKGWTVRSQFSYAFRNQQVNFFHPYNVNGGLPANGNSTNLNAYTLNWQNTITYETTIRDIHQLNVLAGQSIASWTSYNLNAAGTGYPNDLIGVVDVASQKTGGANIGDPTRMASFFGRVQYGLMDKYLLEATLRKDGSSRFGKNNRWGMFPSASVGWKIDREAFLQDVSWLSLLKLRASWGKAGNDRIGAFDYLQKLNPFNYVLGNNVVSGLSPANFGNESLGWETTISKDLGLDASFLQNRFQFSFDYYHNNTKDMLLNVPIPFLTGFSVVRENIGEVVNRGWEIQLVANHISKPNLKWSTTFNISRNQNEVLRMGPGNAPLILQAWGQDAYVTKVGSPIGSYWMYKTDGILTDKDFDASGKALVPIAPGQERGNIRIRDISGPNGVPDGKIDAYDKTICGNNLPDFVWGITNTISYKGFDLNVVLQGSQGGSVFFLGTRHMDAGSGNSNMFSRWLHAWKPEYAEGQNPVPAGVDMSWDGKTPYPKGNNPGYNDTWLYDMTFVRIRSITLGYNFQPALLRRAGISRARVYVMGDNLYTWSRYPGYTPEATTTEGGVTSNLTTMPGTDYGTYPLSRRYNIGIDLSF
ncbi:TonB-dependent receptor [Chitinophaga qingshengii]|uniref:TonB-dependent receptor n=1 Tax=Chitinophaga qingshengii TaxID=1569794 RepID=A0ABR7TF59_9BACT|nr:TonB-dependent receptor [Chitinophaga qingshengii]MBC9928958.1 TonB-dependent receptor [Chitinophaga qingshengii]